MDLIYRGSKDGMSSKSFHDKCDNKGPTITLYKNEKCVFGGYSPISWSSHGNYHTSNDCFIFTLINIFNIKPTKFPLKNNNQYAVCHNPIYGPCFGGGHDISISNPDFNNSDLYSKFPYSYQDILGKGKSIFTGDYNNYNAFFNLKEIEVFELSN